MPDKRIKRLVNNSKANFVKRLKQVNRSVIPDWESNKIATHKLSVGTDRYGNHFIYPEVQEVKGKLIDYTRPPYRPFAGEDSAIERGDTVRIGNTNKDLNDGIKFTEEYKQYYPEFKAGGKTKYKIEAEGGEVIQSNKPIEIKKGGYAIPLGNGFSLLQGNTHEKGGIDINMKGSGRVWSNVPFINGQSPAKRLLNGENPNKLFAQQEIYKNIKGIKDDGTKKELGGYQIARRNEILEDILNNPIYTTDKRNNQSNEEITENNNNITNTSDNKNIIAKPLDGSKIDPLFDIKYEPKIVKDPELDKWVEDQNARNKILFNLTYKIPNNKKVNSLMSGTELGDTATTKLYEGFSPKVYLDANGIPTVAYGETRKDRIKYAKYLNAKGKEVSEETGTQWIRDNYDILIKEIVGNGKNKINVDVWNELSLAQQNALLDVFYNSFYGDSPKMIAAINERNWDEALRQMDIGMADPANKGNTKRRFENHVPFLTLASKEYLENTQDVYDYLLDDPRSQDFYSFVSKHSNYKEKFNKKKNEDTNKSKFGKLIDNDTNGLIYHLNGNVKKGSRYLPFKGERTKAKYGFWNEVNAGDWINAGTNLIGSLLSFGHNYGTANKLPEVNKPLMKQAEKLNTTYNINPQLNTLAETEAAAYKDVNANTTSSNTALNRRQNIRLNSLMSRNQLYDIKAQEENKLINADKLNRQEVNNANVDTYNAYLTDKYNRDSNVYALKNDAINKLINNVAGAITMPVNAVEERIENRNRLLDELDLIKLKYGDAANAIVAAMKKRHGIEE